MAKLCLVRAALSQRRFAFMVVTTMTLGMLELDGQPLRAQNSPVVGSAPAATSTGTVPAPKTEARVRMRLSADWQIASWLIVEHETEISLARFAESRLPSAAAKRWAQTLISDHEQMLAKLRPFADLQEESAAATDKLLAEPAAKQAGVPSPNAASALVKLTALEAPVAGSANPGAAGKKEVGRVTVDVTTPGAAAPVVPVPSATAPTPAAGGDGKTGAVIIAKMDGPGFDLVSLKRELAKQSLESSQTLLGGQAEQEFERTFVALQVAGHAERLVTLQVLHRHASAKLQAVIADEMAQVESHLRGAKELARR